MAVEVLESPDDVPSNSDLLKSRVLHLWEDPCTLHDVPFLSQPACWVCQLPLLHIEDNQRLNCFGSDMRYEDVNSLIGLIFKTPNSDKSLLWAFISFHNADVACIL